jgi:hypothetical protein
MAKKSWYTKQSEAEQARNAAIARLFASMTERELVSELDLIEADRRAMDLDRNAHQSGWERIAKRTDLVRAELAARRQAVALVAA